jgi:hypothetical protein
MRPSSDFAHHCAVKDGKQVIPGAQSDLHDLWALGSVGVSSCHYFLGAPSKLTLCTCKGASTNSS